MAATNDQAGIVLIAVLIMLLLIPTAIMVLYQQSSAFSISVASNSQRTELDYVLDAAVSQARYLTDTNDTCSNFTDLPVTSFGPHSYQASVTQNPALPRRLNLDVTATLDDGSTASRLVQHTGYQPEVVGDIRPAADVTADSANPTVESGFEDYLVISKDGAGESYALLQFNLSGTIPPETMVVSATLVLSVDSFSFTGPLTTDDWLGAHPIGTRWTETASWNEREAGKSWRPQSMGEPIHWDQPVSTWNVAPVDSVSLDMTSFIQHWNDDQKSFHGFLLKSYQSGVNLQVASRDELDFYRRPQLIFSYRCPCGVTCLILLRKQYLDLVKPKFDVNTGTRLCQSDDYRGSHGDIRWTFNQWSEVGDDDDPCAGSLRLDQDPSVVDPDAFQFRFGGDNKTLRRSAWLEDANEVVVSFKYRRDGLTLTTERLFLKASNGGNWVTLATIDGGVTDAEYQLFSADVPQFLVSELTAFALVTENLSETKTFYVDDFSISFTGAVTPSTNLPVLTDSFLDQDKPDDQLASEALLKLRHGDGENMHIITKVDTAGLYDGEIVNSATLRLWVDRSGTDRDAILTLYPLDETWHTTEVTWNDREKAISAWATPGGTYTIPADPADSPSFLLPAGDHGLWVEFDITAFIQSWHDFPPTNTGFLLIMDDTGRGKTVEIPSSKENNVTRRPHVELQL